MEEDIQCKPPEIREKSSEMLKHLILLSILVTAYSYGCNKREYPDGLVCVCNSTYCDTVQELDVSQGKYQIYSTSKNNPGFNSVTGFSHVKEAATTVKVDSATTHQNVIGFGGAFTDSTGINIKSLPEEVQEKLINSYFSKSGIEYNLCRVPMGGTDFSTRGYSYDDVEGDTTLEHFSLQTEDIEYKIPYILKAQQLNSDLKLFSSVWSGPRWMKTNNDWPGIGWLKDEYYQLWADYFLKFFDEYEKNNITFWGLTPKTNQLMVSFQNRFRRLMLWNKWIGENLGPTIRQSSHRDIKIILHDDNRILISLLYKLLENPVTLSYADGVGFHWYTDSFIPASVITTVKSYKEDLFILATEASNGALAMLGLDESVMKGSWTRGANYATSIFDNLENDASGWVDWNMALDETGGPTYINNNIDSPHTG
ncbi:hypothetical protein NQ317_006268 [Molorchus minor]|uniref:Glucosylceramidase n=1 Tax=Molorchus minor TaxID=1323400 RepID=A0ABQ9IX58_9CUCU|nr:hypothetical protein NQ317_006268 [Molorchus minor]